MNFCKNCGKRLEERTTFCSGCGSPTGASPGQSDSAQSTWQNKAGDFFNNFTDTEETHFEQSDVESNKLIAVLAYFGLLFLIPLFVKPNSPFVRYHTNQGIILCIVAVISSIAVGIVREILGYIPLGGLLGGLISAVAGIVVLAFIIIGILNVVNGKAKELPIIGRFRILK